ncbi:hypothetical protein GCM10022282_26470 [Agromyces indicus]
MPGDREERASSFSPDRGPPAHAVGRAIEARMTGARRLLKTRARHREVIMSDSYIGSGFGSGSSNWGKGGPGQVL